MANRRGNNGNSDRLYFGDSKTTADGDCSHETKRRLLLGRTAMTNLDSILKSRDITLPTSSFNQSYGFSSSHIWMWKLDHKESWAVKSWCFWSVVLEKTLESPLDCKEIQPVYPKGDQSWIFIGRTDAEAEIPTVWPPDVKNWLLAKAPDAGEDGGQEGEGDDRGWDGWMASPTQWTWVWVSPESWWWSGKPGVLQSVGSQRVGHDWGTELSWAVGSWKTITLSLCS